MINLIPPVVRKEIIKEYWVRVITVFLFIASVVATASLLLVLPIYVLLSKQVEVFATSAVEASKRVSEYDLSAGALVKANNQAQKIFELREIQNFSGIVEQLLSLQAQGVVIESFDFGRDDKSLAPIQVTGVASTRQSLADFRDRLLKQANISDVILPISNLAKDKDIEFSISIIVKAKS